MDGNDGLKTTDRRKTDCMDSIWFFIYIFTLGVILIKEHDLIYKVFPQYFQNCGMFPWTESNKEKFDQFVTENLFSSFTR